MEPVVCCSSWTDRLVPPVAHRQQVRLRPLCSSALRPESCWGTRWSPSAPQSSYVSGVHVSARACCCCSLLGRAGARCPLQLVRGGFYGPVGTQVLTPLRCAGRCGCLTSPELPVCRLLPAVSALPLPGASLKHMLLRWAEQPDRRPPPNARDTKVLPFQLFSFLHPTEGWHDCRKAAVSDAAPDLTSMASLGHQRPFEAWAQ